MESKLTSEKIKRCPDDKPPWAFRMNFWGKLLENRANPQLMIWISAIWDEPGVLKSTSILISLVRNMFIWKCWFSVKLNRKIKVGQIIKRRKCRNQINGCFHVYYVLIWHCNIQKLIGVYILILFINISLNNHSYILSKHLLRVYNWSS